jgi:hypothetical protein
MHTLCCSSTWHGVCEIPAATGRVQSRAHLLHGIEEGEGALALPLRRLLPVAEVDCAVRGLPDVREDGGVVVQGDADYLRARSERGWVMDRGLRERARW